MAGGWVLFWSLLISTTAWVVASNPVALIQTLFALEEMGVIGAPPAPKPLPNNLRQDPKPPLVSQEQKTLQTENTPESSALNQLAALEKEAAQHWGKEGVKLPSQTEIVKYSEDFKSRSRINLKEGLLIVETLVLNDDQTDPSLIKTLVAALLTPDDPRNVNLLNTKPHPVSSHPFLFGQIEDHHGQPIDDSMKATLFAQWALKKKAKMLNTEVGLVKQVILPLDANHRMVRAGKFAKYIEPAAQANQLDPNLLYAIAETESQFNPFAISPTGAMGLMQLVASKAGLDAMKAQGKARMPTANELYDPATNVQLAAKYVSMLDRRYLVGIQNDLAREYAMIAAYNGGATRALQVFSPDKTQALNKINALPPQMVYDSLKTRHNSAETRGYVQKVTAAKQRYSNRV